MEDYIGIFEVEDYKNNKDIMECIEKFKEKGFTEDEAIHETKRRIAYEMPSTQRKIEHYTQTLKAKGLEGDELKNEVLKFTEKSIRSIIVSFLE